MNAPSFDGSQPCAQSGGDSWFPDDNSSFTTENRIAAALCQTCQFRVPCLEYAVANNVDGIWGGTTRNDRNAIKRQRRGSA